MLYMGKDKFENEVRPCLFHCHWEAGELGSFSKSGSGPSHNPDKRLSQVHLQAIQC